MTEEIDITVLQEVEINALCERIGEMEANEKALLSELAGYKAAIDDAHAILTTIGIPLADRVVCDDPACRTKLGHRMRELVARLSGMNAKLDKVIAVLGKDGVNAIEALLTRLQLTTAVVKAAQCYNARPYGVENGALRAALDEAIREAGE